MTPDIPAYGAGRSTGPASYLRVQGRAGIALGDRGPL